MATDQYANCGLYVDATDQDEIVDVLLRRWDVPTGFGTLLLPGFQISIVKHKERSTGPADDFLSWRAIVEVYASDKTSDDQMVAFVRDLMTYLRSLRYRVVAECDFEDELPQDDLS
jgi:hypothetical protein